jgi:hypothetical protein
MTERIDQMSSVVFPDSLVEKCLRLEAAGSGFSRAMIAIPSIVQTGRPFAATVSLLDENAMPIIAEGESLALSAGTGAIIEIAYPEGRAAVCRVEGLTQMTAGFFRMQGEMAGQSFFSNPALASEADRPPILWGDPHIHTTVGDCHPERCRTRNLAYIAGRYAYGLDFLAIADHVSYAPRGTAGKWFDNLAACELFDEPGVFSTLYCYETSMKGGRGGDCNVYLRQPNPSYVDPWPDDLNIAGLCERVEGEFFAVPHHTTRTGKHGEVPAEAYPGEKLMPVVEIHSKWGTSEYRGNPSPLVDIHPGPSYAQDLLACGYRFGFIGGTDSHTSLTFCRHLETERIRSQPGLTAVLPETNHRDAIFDAIRARRCYAACGERILLDVTCGGLEMGQSGSLPDSGYVTFRADYAAETDIECVEVIRSNEVVHRETPGDWKGQMNWTDTDVANASPLHDFETGEQTVFYYLRLTAQSGARAWSSPCWFELSRGDRE